MPNAKEELRDEYRAIRLKMDSRDVENYSLLICRRLYRELDWSKAGKICSYEPIAEIKEVNITPLLQTAAYKYPAAKIKLLGRSKTQRPPKTKFDLIIVPILAFDKRNHRLGWGSGWYDRFLADQPQALKVGVCFASGLVKGGLPPQPHDVPLDMVVTEAEVFVLKPGPRRHGRAVRS